MSFALLRKEVREHGWVLSAVVLFAGLGLAGQLFTAADQGGRFAALVRFTGVMGTLSAMVTANRLFAREYSGKTQLFLEVLPITRARVMATKWLAGAAFQLGLVGVAWLITLQYMRRSEVITLEDAARALLACETFVLGVWSFAAMAGLLGRYRYVAWVSLATFFFALEGVWKVKPADAPLSRLLGEATAMARTPIPSSALLEVAFLIAGTLLAAVLLCLSGSGSIAATLARRMTARERVFLIAAGVVVLFLGERLREERELPPFDLAKAMRASSEGTVVGVMTTDDVDDERARELGERIVADVKTLDEALTLERRLPVFILPQRGLDPTLTQRADLEGTEGVVVRAAPDVELAFLRSRVLHDLLTEESEYRAWKDDRHVLLDGFAAWWSAQDEAPVRERWWKRAAASRMPISRQSATRWEETSEQLGECVGTATAFVLVDTLVELVGRERAIHLAGRLFSRPRPGILAVMFEASPAALLREAGTDWDSLTAEAERRRLEHRARFEARPERQARIELQDGGVVQVRVSGAERWNVFFTKLGPWSREQDNVRRIDARSELLRLPVTLGPGDRLFAAVDVDDPDLACPVRLEAQRLEAR